MDIALELLDFLNFDLKDERAFKKVIMEKELVKGVPYPYDTCMRLLAMPTPFNRTSQLVKEWLTMKRGACYFENVNGVHTYAAPVPDRQLGGLRVKVEKDRGNVECHVVRSVEWSPIDDKCAQTGGRKGHGSLDALLGSMFHWAKEHFPVDEVRVEMEHYFTYLAGNNSAPFGFAGFVTYGSRSVLVNLALRTIADTVEAAADLVNYKMAK